MVLGASEAYEGRVKVELDDGGGIPFNVRPENLELDDPPVPAPDLTPHERVDYLKAELTKHQKTWVDFVELAGRSYGDSDGFWPRTTRDIAVEQRQLVRQTHADLRDARDQVLELANEPSAPRPLPEVVNLPGDRRTGDVIRKATIAVEEAGIRLDFDGPVTVDNDTRVRGTFHRATGVTSVDPDGAHPAATLLHELGHKLDWELVGGGPNSGVGQVRKYGSEAIETDSDIVAPQADPEVFSELMETLKTSPEARRLESQRGVFDGRTRFGKHTRYLLQPRELFARAFAQYVSSLSPIMEREWRDELSKTRGSTFQTQWDPDYFDQEIRPLFDTLLKEG